jgi:N-sulfoglucosamine sulfohydrolase
MTKRESFLLILAIAICFAGRGSAATSGTPNILFAIADDWGRHAGVYGTTWVATPAFDRVAREGLRFTNAFTPTAKCAPSRAIVLTGRYAWQLEEAGNHVPFFPTKFKAWPEALEEKGWFVGMTGKGWSPGVANDASGKPRQMTGQTFDQHTSPPTARGISPKDYAANFVAFLNAAPANAPWCFWYGGHEPHRGYEFQSGVKKGGRKLSDIGRIPAYLPDEETVRHDLLDYAHEVEHFDRHLARMLAELEKRGLLENTLIMVTSDNGMPFPRAKGFAYPDSNHLPLAVRWPRGISTPGRVIDDFVTFADIAPTVLDVAGLAAADTGMAPITGRSWREIFASQKNGRVVASRDHVLIGKERTDAGRPNDAGYPVRGIIRDGFLYLRNFEPDRWPAGNPETGYLDTDGGPTKTLILEAHRRNPADKYWALGFAKKPAEELYDLSRDPECVDNLAAAPGQQQRRAALERAMTDELKAQGDPRMFGRGEIFDRYPIATSDSRNFYERFMRGENPKAGWVSPGDFEKPPVR